MNEPIRADAGISPRDPRPRPAAAAWGPLRRLKTLMIVPNFPGNAAVRMFPCHLLFWVAGSNLYVILICSSKAITADPCQAHGLPTGLAQKRSSQMSYNC